MVNVKVYSTTNCPWCHRVKDFLKENNMEFEDINIENNQEAAQEMVEKSGQMGVPIIDIGGKIIVGFDEEALREELKL